MSDDERRFQRRRQEAEDRAEFRLSFKVEDPETEDKPAIAVSALLDDESGMIVEVGAGPHGAYTTVTTYRDDESVEPQVFVSGSSVMVVMETEPEGMRPEEVVDP